MSNVNVNVREKRLRLYGKEFGRNFGLKLASMAHLACNINVFVQTILVLIWFILV